MAERYRKKEGAKQQLGFGNPVDIAIYQQFWYPSLTLIVSIVAPTPKHAPQNMQLTPFPNSIQKALKKGS
jgi:hypothetical protein